MVKTKNNNISNNFLSIGKVPPKKAKGIDPIKYGIKSLKLEFPALMYLKQLPDTTIILQDRAITGKIK